MLTESFISQSVFANVLTKASDFFLLLFPFSCKYAGIQLSSMFKTYGGPLSIPRLIKSAIKVSVLRRNENATTINRLVPVFRLLRAADHEMIAKS